MAHTNYKKTEDKFFIYDLVKNGALKDIQNLIENNLLEVNAEIETRYFDDVFDLDITIHKMHLLSAAAACNQFEICEYLFSRGVDPNLICMTHHRHPVIVGAQGFSALFWSCGSNVSSKIVNLLLHHGANQYIANNVFGYALALLLHHMKCSFSRDDLTKIYLLADRFDPNTGNPSQQATVLMNVTEILHQDNDNPLCATIIRKLIDKGIHTDAYAISDNYTDLCCSCSGPRSPLEVAVEALCYDCVKTIIEKSTAMINRKDFGCTPLHILCSALSGRSCCVGSSTWESRNTNMLRLLVQHGAKVNEINFVGKTPLFCSLSPGREYDLVVNSERKKSHAFKRLLIDLGANANISSYDGITPLILSIERRPCDLEDIKLLIDSSELTHSFLGWNLLMYSIFIENVEAVRLLLDRGFDPSFLDSNQMSALHLACVKLNVDIARLLLERGADVNLQDRFKETPLFYITGDLNSAEIKSLLLEYGADEHHKNMLGLTFETMGVFELPVKFYSRTMYLERCSHIALQESEIDYWISSEGWLSGFIERSKFFLERPIILSDEHSQLIAENVQTFLSRIADDIQKNHPELSFTPVLSGSVSEGTKVTYPDEFDFLLCLKHFGNLEIVDKDCLPCYFKLRNQSIAESPFKQFFDKDNYLRTRYLISSICKAVNEVFNKDKIIDSLGLYLVDSIHLSDYHFGNYFKSIISFKLYWVGSSHKFLPISIDLAIAITVNRQPFCVNQIIKNPYIKVEKDEGCLLILKESYDNHIIKGNVRLSFSKIETRILKSCPLAYRLGYMLAKVIREWCPGIIFIMIPRPGHDSDSVLRPEEALSSYLLKTFLLHELNNNLNVEVSPVEVAKNIWAALTKNLEARITNNYEERTKISSFFIDNYLIYEDSSNADYHRKIVKVSQMILTILSKIAHHF